MGKVQRLLNPCDISKDKNDKLSIADSYENSNESIWNEQRHITGGLQNLARCLPA